MSKSSTRDTGSSHSALVFGSQNYMLMAVSAALITVGFVAMHLDGQFLGVVSLTVSPIMIVSGYALLIYAILTRPNDAESAPDDA